MRGKFFYVLAIVIVVLVVAVASFIIFSRKNTSDDGWNNITLGAPRGDFAPPGPIETECKEKLERYQKDKNYSVCELVESKVGETDKECPNGVSPMGCSVCKIRCK